MLTARILIVDNDDGQRTLARTALENAGYEVMLARGGADGISAFERAQPDCVLLDVKLADVDGFSVCEHIRSLPHGAETPILFLTALRDVDTFDRAVHAGGDDYITRPVPPAELARRVESALEQRRTSDDGREHFQMLKHQRDDLLRLQLQKERLMAFVVHDLKNPVNSMDLHAQILLRDKDLSAAGRESAAHIRVEARQLARMISNLLDLSKADEGQLAPKRADLDLRPIVADVLSELTVSAEASHVRLRTSIESGRIHADADLFRRTLSNLVENAIRYAPRDSAVTVSAVTSSDGTEIRVADAGNGIPHEMRERVFSPFVQVESGGESVAPRSSRGLGLAFCKVSVEAHGGQIWIEDACPGTVFCMRLPSASDASRSARP